MAKATFTNVQLCTEWVKQATAEPKGTRGDVVNAILSANGNETPSDEDKRKTYNNVTQRVKQLETHKENPIKFPALAQGQKGARRTAEDMQGLQDIMTPAPTTGDETSTV